MPKLGNKKVNHHDTVEKKDGFLPHFAHYSKMQDLNLANAKMPRHSSGGNFRPFCASIDFLQVFKLGKFDS